MRKLPLCGWLVSLFLLTSTLGWAQTPSSKPAKRQAQPAKRQAQPAKRQAQPAKRQAQPAKRQAKSPRSIELGPMLFRAKGGQVKSIQQLNLRELYQAASQMYNQKKYPTAIKLYQRIIQYFPMHRHMYAAVYNLALTFEDANACKQAIPLYKKVYTSYPQKKQIALNARFRVASCYNHLKRWKKAFSMYDSLLQLDLGNEDRIDALAYSGESLYHLKRHNEALPLLRLAVTLHVRKAPKGSISYAAAMAQYYHARIFDLRFRKRRFNLPQGQLKLDLEYKAKHLLKALRLYLHTIRLRHADWALAAVYRIGEMYEQMYADMMAAPSPKDLNPRETKIYFEELRKKIKVLLEKSLIIYRRGLLLAQRIGIKSNKWKQRSEQRYQAVLAFYHKYFGPPKSLKKPSSRPATPTQPSSRPAAPTTRPAARPKAPTSRPTARPSQ